MKTDHSEQADRPPEEPSSPSSVTDVFVSRLAQLKRLVAGMGFAAADAEDILQDVFVQAWQRRGDSREPDEPGGWLVRVTVNRCLTEFRRRQRFRRATTEVQWQLTIETTSPSDRPTDASIAAEELDIVKDALQELDESLLCPLVLRYFCGLDSGQVGDILQLPPSTVRSRIRKGRMVLAKRLMKRGVQP